MSSKFLLLLFTGLLLISCGGGSGGSSAPPDEDAPMGFKVSDLTSAIDGFSQSSVEFTVTGAEVGTTYTYRIFSSVSSDAVTGSGLVTTSTFTVSGIDISDLPDGLITLELSLEDTAGNSSSVESDTSNKNTLAVDDAVIVSGTVTFDKVPHESPGSGLDYSNITSEPVRGATIHAVNGDGNVLAATTTNSSGAYSFLLASNTDIRIRVRAELVENDVAVWDLKVTDNTNSNALYTLQGDLVNTGNSNSTRDLNAGSGWTGSAYTQTRSAGPFAILDAIYETIQKFVAVDPDINLPALEIRWSVNNSTASGSLTSGDIGTSFYNGQAVYILGDANGDTDEYDSHIVVHEWGHYFEDKLSRSDSIGGQHSLTAKLDMRLAFGEGWGNALSGMILDDPLYKDSSGFRQANGFTIDIDRNNFPDSGWYNEGSVQSILYDLYDSDNDASDTISLGLTPIYEALVSTDYRGDEYLTSIFPFLDQLKTQQPASSAAIDALSLAQDINGSGSDGSGETNNGGLTAVLPIYKDVVVDGAAVILCSSSANGTFNRLGVRDFAFFNLPATANITINATKRPGGSLNRDPDIVVRRSGSLVAIAENETVDQDALTANLSAGDYVIELYDFVIVNGGSGSSCYDLTVTD